MASSSTSSTTATNKLLVLFLLLVLDLGMNCSFDFDSYNLTGKDLITVPLVIQLIIQISIFLVIFLSMAATYLFRVGLLGILIKKFRSVLLLHPLYFFLTLLTGSYRIYLLGEGYDLVKLWEHDEFVALSLVHKCVSLVYYIRNYRATQQLASRIYFDRSVWVSLVQQRKMAQV